jgi:PST family polysaccharide transporter
MRRYLLSLTEGLALITFPVVCGLAFVADDFVLLALGERWHAVVLPLQILAAFTAIRSITPLLPHILNVTNGTRFGMYNSVFGAALGVAAFYIGSFWGVAGIALAWVIVHPIVMSPLFVWVFRALRISVGDYLVALYPALSSTLAMAAILLGIRQLVPGDWLPVTRFGLQVVLGGTAYAVTILLFHWKRVQTFLNIVRTAPV